MDIYGNPTEKFDLMKIECIRISQGEDDKYGWRVLYSFTADENRYESMDAAQAAINAFMEKYAPKEESNG